MQLDSFKNSDFDRGAPILKEILWLIICWLLLSSWLPGSGWRTFLLRLFGARIGQGVIFKPRVRVKFPWRLTIGNHCWIGENVWIDNLTDVTLGDHVCVSQGAYFCTGSHDWGIQSFDLIIKPIRVYSFAWIAAKSVVGPGVEIGEGAVLGLGGIATRTLNPWTIYTWNPLVSIKARPRS